VKVVNGDLIELALAGEFNVIAHGCNCFCTMGAGIAKSIKQHFPEAFEADVKTAKGDREKLGTYSVAKVNHANKSLVVVNAYTQYHWQGSGVKADYAAIRNVFAAIKKDFAGSHIAFPKIGAGLAGGDWSSIARIISEELAGMRLTLVVYQP
jgi:O-acetyl-ADP-ribose deacetylase (regulator of RNase III)